MEPQTYKVVVHNQYFEKVSVSIGDEDKIEIMPSEKSRPFLLEKGDYEIRCLSKSNLLFTSTLSLKGVKGQVKIIIDNKGIRLN